MQQDPDQYKNLILAVVLSMAVLVAWEYFYARPQEAKRRAQEQSQQVTPPTVTPDNGVPSPNATPQGTVPAAGPVAAASAILTYDAYAGALNIAVPLGISCVVVWLIHALLRQPVAAFPILGVASAM